MGQQHYKFCSNRECEFFPCHKGIAPERFNCLFCYCPLYVLGEDCGGRFTYTEEGLKDCSACTLPHDPERFDDVVSRYPEIAALMQHLRQEREKRE